jgi:hypothetical protein
MKMQGKSIKLQIVSIKRRSGTRQDRTDSGPSPAATTGALTLSPSSTTLPTADHSTT